MPNFSQDAKKRNSFFKFYSLLLVSILYVIFFLKKVEKVVFGGLSEEHTTKIKLFFFKERVECFVKTVNHKNQKDKEKLETENCFNYLIN